MSTGENAIFHVKVLACSECDADYEAEFDAEGSTAYIEWTCEEPLEVQPLSSFINGIYSGFIALCGYENSREVEL